MPALAGITPSIVTVKALNSSHFSLNASAGPMPTVFSIWVQGQDSLRCWSRQRQPMRLESISRYDKPPG